MGKLNTLHTELGKQTVDFIDSFFIVNKLDDDNISIIKDINGGSWKSIVGRIHITHTDYRISMTLVETNRVISTSRVDIYFYGDMDSSKIAEKRKIFKAARILFWVDKYRDAAEFSFNYKSIEELKIIFKEFF